jgi:hypothetical protein
LQEEAMKNEMTKTGEDGKPVKIQVPQNYLFNSIYMRDYSPEKFHPLFKQKEELFEKRKQEKELELKEYQESLLTREKALQQMEERYEKTISSHKKSGDQQRRPKQQIPKKGQRKYAQRPQTAQPKKESESLKQKEEIDDQQTHKISRPTRQYDKTFAGQIHFMKGEENIFLGEDDNERKGKRGKRGGKRKGKPGGEEIVIKNLNVESAPAHKRRPQKPKKEAPPKEVTPEKKKFPPPRENIPTPPDDARPAQIKRIKDLMNTTRWLPNTAFQTYFGKPAFHNYGTANTNPAVGGSIYGNYLLSHNINPQTFGNQPEFRQVKIIKIIY